MNQTHVSLRRVRTEDEPFLFDVYAGVRIDEFATLNWPRHDLNQFLAMQFKIQNRNFEMAYPDADFWIIEADGISVGRFYLRHEAAMVHIIEIALLPHYRNHGIGPRVLSDAVKAAAKENKGVRLHVEENNTQAAKLYERLGFSEIGRNGIHRLMEWRPAPGI